MQWNFTTLQKSLSLLRGNNTACRAVGFRQHMGTKVWIYYLNLTRFHISSNSVAVSWTLLLFTVCHLTSSFAPVIIITATRGSLTIKCHPLCRNKLIAQMRRTMGNSIHGQLYKFMHICINHVVDTGWWWDMNILLPLRLLQWHTNGLCRGSQLAIEWKEQPAMGF